MLAVIVRPADEGDMPGLLRIEQECFGNEKFSPETVRAFVEREDTLVFVATEGQLIIASAMCMVSSLHREGRIASIAVLPDLRRRGTGSKLLDECEAAFDRHGLTKYTLEVDTMNEAAIMLYISKGYEINGMIENFYGAGRHAYMMKKKAPLKKRRISVRSS